MAIINMRMEVCDVCRDKDLPVTKVRLAVGAQRLRTLALCETHGEGIVTMASTLTGSNGHTPRKARTRVSMAEIEKVKQSRQPRNRRVKSVHAAVLE